MTHFEFPIYTMEMKLSSLHGFVFLALVLSSCNLYGGLSKPGSDPQYLVAARACLDRGDYQCAQDNYAALSSTYNDIKVSENSLTQLAKANIFSISDLVNSLGNDLGSSSSFIILAEVLASRNIIDGASRTIIKSAYDSDAQIQDTQLKAFSKFLAALAMFNEVLANAVGPDGKLTGSDIVLNPTTCRSGGAGSAGCAAPTSTSLVYSSSPGTEPSMTTAGTDWSGTPTLQKLINAVVEASTELTVFAGISNSNQGLLLITQSLSSTLNSAVGDKAVRYGILTVLDLH